MAELSVAEVAEMRAITERGVKDAPLPIKYAAAKQALAECSSVDECSTWAKKAAALASYARQADDDSLEKMAMRIRARAVRRCGELLKEIPSKPGKRTDLEPRGSASPRLEAASAAGLSTDQTKDALRVARVPAKDFEKAVESERPPTVAALAEAGTRKVAPLVDLQGRDPAAFNRALLLAGDINDLADQASRVKPSDIASGCLPRQVVRLLPNARSLSKWLLSLAAELENIK